NLLRHAPGLFFQGPQLHPVGAPPVAMPAVRNDARGTTHVDGNRVVYDLTLGETGQHLRLEWEILPDRLVLHAERTADRPLRAWRASAWTLALHSAVAACHVVAPITRTGETGYVSLPAWLHAP